MNSKLSPISNFILDMDGVLWHGNTPVPGLNAFFDQLDRLDIGYVLATNNATKSPAQYALKLAGFGINLPESRILTSAEATASYLQHDYPAGSTAYVVGEKGLREAILSHGFSLFEDNFEELPESQADVVVVGMTRHVCYEQLAIANHLINQGADFIGTNPDVTFPSEFGLMPGAGSILAFLETSSGITPTVIGKPNAALFEEALHRLPGTVRDTVMVGDRINTDVIGALRLGLRAILLLSGISNREELDDSNVRPDWVFEDLLSLTNALATDLPVGGPD